MIRRLTIAVCGLVIALAVSTLPARADDKAALDAVAQGSVAAFLSGNAAGLAALGAPGNQTVMDEFGKHYWTGPNALVNWFNDFTAEGKKDGQTDFTFHLGRPKFTEIDGSRAWSTYASAHYSYKMSGTVYHETGIDVYTFEKVAGTWRILGFAWGRTS